MAFQVSCIADDILIAGFDKHGRDHNTIMEEILWICKQSNLKLNKGKYLYRCTSIPFFGEIISWQGVGPNPSKFQALIDMPLLKKRKTFNHSWGYSKLHW